MRNKQFLSLKIDQTQKTSNKQPSILERNDQYFLLLQVKKGVGEALNQLNQKCLEFPGWTPKCVFRVREKTSV